MKHGLVWVFGSVAATIVLLSAGTAGAADIAPHRALYTMSLGQTHGDAGVTGAGGTMAYQWGESCDGWTVEQRYRLKMAYGESSDVSISSNFVTWEAKDGLKYRFNQKETGNGNENEGIRGQAKLDGPDKAGTVEFEKPQPKSIKLPPGVLFPSAHTMFLIDKAKAGENFISRQIFDGATVENAVLVSAVIGAKVEPDEESAKKSPLLNRPGWRVAGALPQARPAARTARGGRGGPRRGRAGAAGGGRRAWGGGGGGGGSTPRHPSFILSQGGGRGVEGARG